MTTFYQVTIAALLALALGLSVNLVRTRRALDEERAKFARAFPSVSTEAPSDCAFRERAKAIARIYGLDFQ